MDDRIKNQVLAQLKKAQGMIKKVVSMIENESYCIDVLQQSLAANGFIRAANKTILENHLQTCFKSGLQSKNKKVRDELVNELLRISHKF